jgi:hypothetical protein
LIILRYARQNQTSLDYRLLHLNTLMKTASVAGAPVKHYRTQIPGQKLYKILARLQ